MNNLKAKTFILISALNVCLHGLAQQGREPVAKDHALQTTNPDSPYAAPSYKVVAGNTRLKTTGLNKMLLGENYRKDWTQPIRVPVLNLHNYKGGLTPVKEGGGKETRSLVVKDAAGTEYALRSIQKFPENALPEAFRKTVAVKIARDNISASYPYAALSIGVLAKAAGLPYLKDQLMFLPDDTTLGEYRQKYKNMLVLMEEKEPDSATLQMMGIRKKTETLSTNELIEALQKSNRNTVDQKAVLAIRLLDNFIMDFDRHEGQWMWIAKDTGGGKIYYPIPKDRDQAFYTNQGFVPGFASGKGLFPELQGFRAKAKDITTFNRAARNFDRYFLSGITEGEWRSQTISFLQLMTDSVIEAALRQQPAEIQGLAAQKIIEKLKKRRKYFLKEMMAYYRTLARSVAVKGSNEAELVSVNTAKDGLTTVTVSRLDSTGNIAAQMYQRSFIPGITKEVVVYGLEGNDRFEVSGAKSKIKVRMVGGPGSDQFVNKGRGGKILAYDVKADNNDFSAAKGLRNKESNDPQNNLFNRLAYKYSYWSTGISVDYSVYGRIFVGPKLKQVKQGFRKEPYSIHQSFAVNRSLIYPSYHFTYEGEFVHVLGHTNLEFNGEFRRRSNKTNFFGFGNNTEMIRTKPGGPDYYLTTYDIGDLSLLMTNKIDSWLQFKYGPSFQYLKLRSNENKDHFVTSYINSGITPYEYKSRYYGGAEARLEINTTNDKITPSRGIIFDLYGRTLLGINKYANDVTQTGANLRWYQHILPKDRLVFATSIGADHNFGNFALEQAQYLGYEERLRGFRIQRFAGRSRAYNNTELRWKIADINAYLFPASIGLVGFHDIGRVWQDGEKSSTWHRGYGLGLWVAPANRFLVIGSLTYSKEEQNLGIVTFGYQF